MTENKKFIVPADRLKIYSAMAEVTRKWVTVMDAKAAFLSGLNAAVLTLIWAGLKLGDAQGVAKWFAIVASLLLLLSMCISIWVVLPRGNLSAALRKPIGYAGSIRPVSFYGYVADNFPAGKFEEFRQSVLTMDEESLAWESLEQHYTISHVVNTKSNLLKCAGIFWIAAILVMVLAVLNK